MRWIVLLLLCVLGPIPAAAQAFPERLIRMIVPYPAGGSTDILARAIQQPMSDVLGRPVVIDNKPGAGGIIGTTEAARSAPDGYTIVFGNLGPNALNASLYKRLPYDPIRDFAPISIVAEVPFILVATPALAAKSVGELVALARKDPAALTFASVGLGSASHVTGELFKRQAGIEMRHVPYRGGAPAVNDIVAGHVSLLFATPLESVAHIQDGRMRVLGVSPKARTAMFPDAPTISETLPGFEVSVWFGILAPAGTPPEVIAKLNDAVERAVNSRDVQEKLQKLGVEPKTTSPAAFAATIRSDVEKWGKVVEEAGLKLD